ncbi:hypothetical protein AZE42_12974 [Rhizopogon vesiculosus]|uniref:Uncharacterized protein n=1 Tax=Rhizopogon vesiculosus TaxID=180088 RepID=A0A1J8Q8W9_9AGAM|nr:hypothetical protein AZE42_12974 [Rhizopogon vesiculosus]
MGVINVSLAWTPDGIRLLSTGTTSDPTIREHIIALAVNSTGTLLASASFDNHVRLWRLSDRQTIAIFTTAGKVYCVAFSMNGKRILSGGEDKKISEWAVPNHAPKDQASEACYNSC